MMSMTPKEIVHMAMARARTDMIEDLRVNEFIYCFPIEKVDYSMLESLCRFSFERLVGVCAKVRKGDRGKSDRYVELGEFRFMLSKCPHGHLVVMDSEDPLMLKWIPEDMDEILAEFCEYMKDAHSVVESILAEYWAMRKAGDIAMTAVNVQLGSYLKENGMQIYLLVDRDGTWRCFMNCDKKERTISFLSGPMSYMDDIKRVANSF